MPYLLLIIGCLIGFYALYRFFLNADIRQIKAFFLTTCLIILSIALFYMALTGRLAAALGLMVAMAPVILAIIKEWQGRVISKDLDSSLEKRAQKDDEET